MSIVRGGKPVPDKVDLTRTMVTEPAVAETLYENSSILYLKPVILDQSMSQAIEAKLKAAEKTGLKKVLLDLRDVAGGDMAEATRLANFFLRTGTIATLEGQKVAKVTYTAEAKQVDPPVRADGGAGEPRHGGSGGVGRAALLDDKRAELVGEKTFGVGTQTKLFELPDGAASDPFGRQVRDAGRQKAGR